MSTGVYGPLTYCELCDTPLPLLSARRLCCECEAIFSRDLADLEAGRVVPAEELDAENKQ